MKKLKLNLFWVSILCFMTSLSVANEYLTSDGTFIVTQLNGGKPIVSEAHFQALGATVHEGSGLNGPSVIRVPDWIPESARVDPSAQYYMYFAHHTGKYIRLAWASTIEGTWSLYHVGQDIPIGERGVLDLGDADISLGNGIVIPNNHLASPSVHVDHQRQRIILYFHSGSTIRVDGEAVNGQKTFVATSSYGLAFINTIEPVILGDSYFSVFEYGGTLYSLDNGAGINQAKDSNDPWAPPSDWDFSRHLWTNGGSAYQDDIDADGYTSAQLRVRHTSTWVDGDTLYTFYSRRGVTPPERIMLSTTELNPSVDFSLWDPSYPPEEIYTAQPGWEGGQLEVLDSETASAPENVNQLRDPFIFQDDDGELYIFYAGAGEDAIGLIHLEQTGQGNLDTTPPVPHSMTWASPPTPVGAGAITMTATTASDDEGVKYYFENLVDSSHDSGWQISPTYTDIGLDDNKSYHYRVQARDMSSNQNKTVFSPVASATTMEPKIATVFQAFNVDPTNNHWVNAAQGSTQFNYHNDGYLVATVHRDSGNRALFYLPLETPINESQEFWMSMDVKLISASSNLSTSLFGLFGVNDNHSNFIGDRFFYKQNGGQSRGNRHDLYGYAADGTQHNFASDYIAPGITEAQSVRVNIHYTYDNSIGRASINVYNINSVDGSDGDFIMGAVPRTVIGKGHTVQLSRFGIGNRTDGADSGDNVFAVDNVYFSITRANPTPQKPSWMASGFVFSEGFEGCFTHWTSDGFCSGYAHTGEKSLKLDNAEHGTTAISTIGASSLFLTYWRDLSDMNSDDEFVSEWFDGVQWFTIETQSHSDSGWAQVSFELPKEASNNAEFQLRFRVDNGSKDFAYVDDIQLYE